MNSLSTIIHLMAHPEWENDDSGGQIFPLDKACLDLVKSYLSKRAGSASGKILRPVLRVLQILRILQRYKRPPADEHEAKPKTLHPNTRPTSLNKTFIKEIKIMDGKLSSWTSKSDLGDPFDSHLTIFNFGDNHGWPDNIAKKDPQEIKQSFGTTVIDLAYKCKKLENKRSRIKDAERAPDNLKWAVEQISSILENYEKLPEHLADYREVLTQEYEDAEQPQDADLYKLLLFDKLSLNYVPPSSDVKNFVARLQQEDINEKDVENYRNNIFEHIKDYNAFVYSIEAFQMEYEYKFTNKKSDNSAEDLVIQRDVLLQGREANNQVKVSEDLIEAYNKRIEDRWITAECSDKGLQKAMEHMYQANINQTYKRFSRAHYPLENHLKVLFTSNVCDSAERYVKIDEKQREAFFKQGGLLGQFCKEIKNGQGDCEEKYKTKYGDYLKEAGFQENEITGLKGAFERNILVRKKLASCLRGSEPTVYSPFFRYVYEQELQYHTWRYAYDYLEHKGDPSPENKEKLEVSRQVLTYFGGKVNCPYSDLDINKTSLEAALKWSVNPLLDRQREV